MASSLSREATKLRERVRISVKSPNSLNSCESLATGLVSCRIILALALHSPSTIAIPLLTIHNCADPFLPRSERGTCCSCRCRNNYRTMVTYNVWCSWMLQLRWMCVCHSQISPFHPFRHLSAYLHARDSCVDLLVFVPIPPPYRVYPMREEDILTSRVFLSVLLLTQNLNSSMCQGRSMPTPNSLSKYNSYSPLDFLVVIHSLPQSTGRLCFMLR